MSQQYFSSTNSASAAASSSSSATVGTPTQASSDARGSDDYFNQSHSLSSPVKDGAHADEQQLEKMAAMEEHSRRFAAARDGLVSAINETGGILTSLRDFNKQRWIVHYPAIDRKPSTQQLRQRQALRRTMSSAPTDDESAAHHPGLHRSSTEAPSAIHAERSESPAPVAQANVVELNDDAQEEEANENADDQNEMSVLRLDLKLGAIGNNPQALVHSLEKSSIAQLLDERMTSSIRQLDSLRDRISDTQSKVLVTGDLNAGKSTFVNSLMRRRLMPVDQQPCTTVFCEVLDAEQTNEGREEVHLIKPGMLYDLQNDNTYTRHSLADIEQIVADAEELDPEDAPMLKCYCHDTRSTQESLLRNGIVDIALIDAPGLNRDSLKTTALFARQEQIDVVVFVVSAENHFTLSAKEFLWNASNDKAYIFIVVNKFDQIRNKDKCKRLVLEQIKQLSPRTYEDAEELVHFVDSGSVFGEDVEASTPTEDKKHAGQDVVASTAAVSPAAMSFTRLEACLRDFVLQRREKSKLMPAQTYLLRLLSDIEFLAHTNLGVATAELEEAKRLLEEARPALAQCKAAHAKIEQQLEGEEDGVVSNVSQSTQGDLDLAVELIGQGKPASLRVELPPYPGFFSALDYAASVREAFVRSLEYAVREAEQVARTATGEAVQRIKTMGDAHLPADVERSRREFRPDAMFAKRLRRQNSGVVGLGLGLGLDRDITNAKLSDVFDIGHYVQIVQRHTIGGGEDSDDEDDVAKSKKKSSSLEDEMALVSSATLGLGALSLLGGKAYGAKSAYDAVVNLTNFISSPTVRKYGPYVVALVISGFAAHTIIDMPNAIPRTVGRDMRRQLRAKRGSSSKAKDAIKALTSSTSLNSTTVAAPDSSSTEIVVSFSTYHQDRMAREVRKVLRLAGWDLQERFRVALAERRGVVERLEGQEGKSKEAIVWFGETSGNVKEVRERVNGVEIVS